MISGCRGFSFVKFLFLGFILLSHSAKASSCATYLFIDNEFRALLKIANKNKERREELMASNPKDRRRLVEEHLKKAVYYEEEKARIYVAMLDKLLQHRGAFNKTSVEIRRRLLRSLKFYDQMSEQLSEVEGFSPRPIDVPMSPRVAHFVDSVGE